jgi:hypothetical protein
VAQGVGPEFKPQYYEKKKTPQLWHQVGKDEGIGRVISGNGKMWITKRKF